MFAVALYASALLAAPDVGLLSRALPAEQITQAVCSPSADTIIKDARNARVRRVCRGADGKAAALVEVITGHGGANLAKLTRSRIGAASARANLRAERHSNREALVDTDTMRMTVVTGSQAVVVIQTRDAGLMTAIARSVKYNLIDRVTGTR